MPGTLDLELLVDLHCDSLGIWKKMGLTFLDVYLFSGWEVRLKFKKGFLYLVYFVCFWICEFSVS